MTRFGPCCWGCTGLGWQRVGTLQQYRLWESASISNGLRAVSFSRKNWMKISDRGHSFKDSIHWMKRATNLTTRGIKRSINLPRQTLIPPAREKPRSSSEFEARAQHSIGRELIGWIQYGPMCHNWCHSWACLLSQASGAEIHNYLVRVHKRCDFHRPCNVNRLWDWLQDFLPRSSKKPDLQWPPKELLLLLNV